MSDAPGQRTDQSTSRTVDLGDVEPRGTRQQWRRSAVFADEQWDLAAVGTADGGVIGFDLPTGEERFRTPAGDRVVALSRAGDDLIAGTRGADGWIRGLDPETGECRWSVRSADEIGEAAAETLFAQPFVVSLAPDDGQDGRVYAAARRYERRQGSDGSDRHFESVVYAIDRGEIAWRHRADASAIALSADADRVAVGYNRCPGTHQDGLVVLDPATGQERWTWDPEGDGQRRIGDVAVSDHGVAVASHADYRGVLVDDGEPRWRVDLGRPVDDGEQTIYAYPTQVTTLDDGFAFITGNTFPEQGRETDRRHPDEHTMFVLDAAGSRLRSDRIGGWVSELAGDRDRLLVPCGQHFRDRDPVVHGLYETTPTKSERRLDAGGPITAVDATDDGFVALEEPIAFHDEATDGRGRYRLHFG